MRVVVTGAAGQVGSELPAALAGHDVVALTRADLDLGDLPTIQPVLERVHADAVVNCAAYNAVDRAEEEPEAAMLVNAEAVAELARACASSGAHLVHVSTDYVFDGEKDAAYDERDEPAPQSAYGRSKRAGEVAVMESRARWTVVRTAWVFGRVGRSFVETMVSRGAAGEPLRVVDDQRGSPTYAADLSGMLARMVSNGVEGLFHVTNAGACTWFELATEVLDLAGVDQPVLEQITTADLARPAPRPRNSVLTSVRLGSVGLEPLRHYSEALRALVPELVEAGSTRADR